MSSGDVPVVRSGSGRAVSSAELEQVIRRASNLQFRARDYSGHGLEEGDVVQIGEEVGLEPRYVRQALAELHADSLIPILPRGARVTDRFWGHGWVRATRVVPGSRSEVEGRLERYFEQHELLKRVRSQPGRSLWEAAGGLVSSMKRAMDVGGHGYRLAKARGVDVMVEPLESGWSLVAITVDLRNERTAAAAGWHLGMGGLAVAAATLLVGPVGPEIPLLLGSGLAGSAGLGAATWGTSAHFHRRRARVQLDLEGLLDRLETEEPLAPLSPNWRKQLLG